MSNIEEIIDTLSVYLQGSGITRSAAEISYALQAAAEAEAEIEGTWVPPEDIHWHLDHWHYFMHRAGGVLDLLDVDSEDTLYDRRT